jgi:hypothetical protein
MYIYDVTKYLKNNNCFLYYFNYLKCLEENRDALENMAKLLIEKETIYTEEVAMLMKGANWKEVVEAMEGKEELHAANPFASMTTPDKDHVIEDKPEETPVVEETDENKAE